MVALRKDSLISEGIVCSHESPHGSCSFVPFKRHVMQEPCKETPFLRLFCKREAVFRFPYKVFRRKQHMRKPHMCTRKWDVLAMFLK